MKKQIISFLCAAAAAATLLTGCGSSAATSVSSSSTAAASAAAETSVSSSADSASVSAASSTSSAASASETVTSVSSTSENAVTLADGTYTANFNTDSSMFAVNEANDKKGTLTVKDGKMTIHVSLMGTGIVNLFMGTKEDAQKDGAELLQPTNDTVTYDDGYTEDVYGFDIPVPAIDKDFTVSIIGTKGKWYQHTVSVTDPVPQTADNAVSSGSTSTSSAN